MEVDHPTAEPEQFKTDEFMVLSESQPNLELIARIEVPRYSQPDASGEELSLQKRLSLAVARAVEKEWSVVPDPHGVGHSHTIDEGHEFMVMHDLDEPMAFVQYEQNPAFDGVWNPDGDA